MTNITPLNTNDQFTESSTIDDVFGYLSPMFIFCFKNWRLEDKCIKFEDDTYSYLIHKGKTYKGEYFFSFDGMLIKPKGYSGFALPCDNMNELESRIQSRIPMVKENLKPRQISLWE